ncbi:unnamed protein product [Tetraodon nigroviridis]|uniref:(spotted green pufferfish) hypothetical protein n=1 Tax=Tetraodon nigroviridis TaxID=99883 RepID=Q4SAT4_TETNG|nr:unnamed protein product [Tetraodon nigroviridis]
MGISAWQLTCLSIGVICVLLFIFYCLLFTGRSKEPPDLQEEAEARISV